MGIPSQEQVALLTDYDQNSAFSAAYRTIYANIQFHWKDAAAQQHAILLATPAAYAGQATATANVAIAAAQSGTATILVDADLSNPSLQQRFGVGEAAGLSNLLTGTEAITPQTLAAHLCKTFIPELRLLTAGTASQAGIGLLHAQTLRAVLNATRCYLAETERATSLIIFTAPPVLASVDASTIGALVDQTFLTIVSGRTTRRQAQRAQEQLERAQAQLAGSILLDM